MSDRIRRMIDYHDATRHHFERYARGPSHLDWATQPDPFRRYQGAPLIPLEKRPPSESPLDDPRYDAAFMAGAFPAAPLNRQTLSQLLYDSLALSAWKRAGTSSWALRVNPSSGNLHPTEGYVLCGPETGIDTSPVVCHYAPREHALEIRARLPGPLWETLTEGLPPETVLLGLTSIHWREAWKYGERAYRYCQLDVGHALGAIGMAAAGLGWQAMLLERFHSRELAAILGTWHPSQAEEEEPDCLIAVSRWGALPPGAAAGHAPHPPGHWEALSWLGVPNRLSSSRVPWRRIDEAAEAARKEEGGALGEPLSSVPPFAWPSPERPLALRRIIHQRRSAVAMDSVAEMPRATFYGLLAKTLPGPNRIPFNTLPWAPFVHLALFVHRIDGLAPGLYCLVRDARQRADLEASLSEVFLWERPEGCPQGLPLFLLAPGDVRDVSMRISCYQDIASDGCFSVAMIAAFATPLERYGAALYPRLHWECGMIGQVLYLEAEAAGLGGTGIGCFFDHPTHAVLGIGDLRYQDLYHFTVGGPIEDPRLTTLPPYP